MPRKVIDEGFVKHLWTSLPKTTVTLRKVSAVSNDEYANITTYNDYNIEVVLLPTKSETIYHKRTGEVIDKALAMWAKPQYIIDGTTITVEPGDKVLYTGGNIQKEGEVLEVKEVIMGKTLLLRCWVR